MSDSDLAVDAYRPGLGRLVKNHLSQYRDSAGRYFERWITDLPRERFEIVVYHLQPALDPLAARLRERADEFRHCPRWRLSEVAPRVRADALDVLVYPELGMDATTFGAASLRLAPRQCAAWGHPAAHSLAQAPSASLMILLMVRAQRPHSALQPRHP